MHLTFLFFASWGCYFSAAFNAVAGITDALFVLILAAVGLVTTGLWLRARHTQRPHGMAALFCLLILFVILPLNWFYNQGATGPTLMLFVLLAAYALGAIVLNPWQRFGLISSFLVVPTMLLFAGYRHPEWIPAYSGPEQRLLDLSVSYYITIAMLVILMRGYFQRFENEHRRTRDTARRDSLTGLLNHGAFHEVLQQYGQQRPPQASHAILLLYDLDHFKQVNDQHGHAYGDQVLRHFSHLLRAAAERYDGVSGRLGGEEFSIFLPQGSRADVLALDAVLRDHCQDQPLAHGDIRFSGGAAFDNTAPFSVDEWFGRSDRALYQAKHNGRNHLLVDGEPVPTTTADAAAEFSSYCRNRAVRR
ncbi:GGDEF domain-containing protein [Salinisphaera sp. SPP-AMP-43]|uniref:GGDEF domain-containing protein n=1 Tax=Salinisphaera sp. SPP-AMP-43 TaxID=3121288 RepID=UPI003C6DF43C